MSPRINQTIVKGKQVLHQLRRLPERLINCEPPVAYGRRIDAMLRELRREGE
jgi:hypothetical protein